MSDEYMEAVQREREGALSGINPMFGEWSQNFQIDPVPYGDGGAKRAAFRASVQPLMTNQFFYSHNVHVDITLYLDVQDVLETSDTADLDNYAKCILDAMKGPKGILLDDSQVQALSISWLDKRKADGASFFVKMKAAEDAFRLKPLSFYEMPNGLWYPFSEYLWTDGKAEATKKRDLFLGLRIEASMTRASKTARRLVRESRGQRVDAYRASLSLASIDVRGFHRSRIDDGFAMVKLTEWSQAMSDWIRDNPEDAAAFDAIDGMEESHLTMASLLAGRVRNEIWVPDRDANVHNQAMMLVRHDECRNETDRALSNLFTSVNGIRAFLPTGI